MFSVDQMSVPGAATSTVIAPKLEVQSKASFASVFATDMRLGSGSEAGYNGLESLSPPATRTGAISGLGGKCLDVTGGSTANGNLPQIWACTGGPNQIWTLGADGTVRSLGKCLDVANNSTADGAAVHLWDCLDPVASQKWTASNGLLVNAASGKCLDVKDNNAADGAKLQIWTCTGAANQKWTVPE